MLAKNTCCCTAGRRAPKCSSFAAFAFDLLQIPKQDLYRMRDITHARERVLEALQLPQRIAHMLDLSTQDTITVFNGGLGAWAANAVTATAGTGGRRSVDG